MKKLFWPRVLLLVVLVAACMMACKDDDKPKLIPELTTSPVTDITPTTAMGGGEIISDGNDKITVSGICWSSSNNTPTTADSKSELPMSEGVFISKMENLPSGSTIYVRSYATNSVGTGYGNTQTFMTGNAAPIAANIAITGVAEVNKSLTGTYSYTDAENNAEGSTSVQWYRASDGSGTGEVAIVGATYASYTLQDVDEFAFIRFGVTPKATSGNLLGVEVKSSFVGPVAVRTTITFTYNNTPVTYGIITSSITGRKWLDRNLGAPNSPTSYNDYANYGDLFQWGRAGDGHQLVTRNTENSTFIPVNGITTNLSTTDSPGHSLFISPSTTQPRDWRIPQNGDMWNSNGGVNNPCPTGWHVPSETEWDAENVNGGDIVTLYTQLKLTLGSGRSRTGAAGSSLYWSSTSIQLPAPSTTRVAIAYYFTTPSSGVSKTAGEYQSLAFPCRCIKNQ